MKDLKEKDRVIFKDGIQFREGTVMEISPTRAYVKLKYILIGCVVDYWLKTETVVEILL